MLILRRKGGESLVIGDQISVTILSVDASGTVMLAPVVHLGKIWNGEGDRTVLPVSLNIHHAVADGFHLSRFFLELQELLDAPAEHS